MYVSCSPIWAKVPDRLGLNQREMASGIAVTEKKLLQTIGNNRKIEEKGFVLSNIIDKCNRQHFPMDSHRHTFFGSFQAVLEWGSTKNGQSKWMGKTNTQSISDNDDWINILFSFYTLSIVVNQIKSNNNKWYIQHLTIDIFRVLDLGTNQPTNDVNAIGKKWEKLNFLKFNFYFIFSLAATNTITCLYCTY